MPLSTAGLSLDPSPGNASDIVCMIYAYGKNVNSGERKRAGHV